MTIQAVIKWRGEKKIVSLRIGAMRERNLRMIYFCEEYCMYLNSDYVYPLSIDGLRSYTELKDSCSQAC